MKDRYWFRLSKKGVGWVPVTWQGWWLNALYIVALIYSFFQVNNESQSFGDTLLRFLPQFLLFSALLIIITYLKGEPLPGKSDKDKEKII